MSRCRLHVPLLALAASLCLGAHCGDLDFEPEIPDEPRADAAVMLTTELDDAPPVRVRRLRDDVVLNCRSLHQSWLTFDSFDAGLFEPGSDVQVEADRDVLVKRVTHRPCELVRIEHPAGDGFVARVLEGGLPSIDVTAEGLAGDTYAGWLRPKDAEPRHHQECVLPNAGPSLSWSTPVPVGREMRVEEITVVDGCTRLSLRTPDWDGPERFPWRVCAGPVRLPLRAGDRVSIEVSQPAPNTRADGGATADDALQPDDGAQRAETIRIERHPRDHSGQLPERVAIWLSRGGSLLDSGAVARSIPNVSLVPASGCVALPRAACSSTQMAVRARLTDARRSLELGAGENIQLKRERGRFELFVLRAQHQPVVDRSCSHGRDARHDDFELVAIEHQQTSRRVIAEQAAAL